MRRILLGVLITFSPTAVPHPLDLGSLLVAIRTENIVVQLDVSPRLVEKLSPQTNSATGGLATAALAEPLFAVTLKASAPRLDNESCDWSSPSASSEGSNIRLTALARCPKSAGKLEWSVDFLKKPEMPPTFQLVTQVRDERSENGAEKSITLDKNNLTLTYSVAENSSLGNFVMMGIAHIGATPAEWRGENGLKLPDGFDHIVFLFALLLVGGGLLCTLKTITGFTLGHSVTLALGTLGWLKLSPKIIEPAIALSIAYIAVETIFFPRPEKKWRIAALFGLIHGCGFAAALTEMHLSGRGLLQALLGFNLGVELGQLILMIGLLPPLMLLARFPQAHRVCARFLSGIIFLTACYWFAERTFL